MRTHVIGAVAALWIGTAFVLADQVCTVDNAQSVDAGVSVVEAIFLVYLWWLIGAFVIWKREGELDRRDFTCTSSEQCLKARGHQFCFNKDTHDFHTPAGTVGNSKTGDYTLADGRKGNFYHGPFPGLDEKSKPTVSPTATPTVTVTVGADSTSTTAETAIITTTTTTSGAVSGGTSTTASAAATASRSAGEARPSGGSGWYAAGAIISVLMAFATLA